MLETLGDFIAYLSIIVIGLLVWAALSPFETLGWWAGWFGEKIYVDDLPSDGLVRAVRPGARSYILFLSGIGRVSGETFSRREQGFLQRLATALPDAVVIDDIFPYSVNNLALGLARQDRRPDAGRLYHQYPQHYAGVDLRRQTLWPNL